MAEALDTYSDLDMTDSDEEGGNSGLNKQFNSAADHMKILVSKLDAAKLLEVYGLYKQATAGPCDIPRPKWYEMQAKQKWDVWNSLGDMSSETAKEKYVSLITELDPKWKEQNSTGDKSSNVTYRNGTQWAAVSSLNSTKNEEMNEADKTPFDFCKEGIVWKVKSIVELDPDILEDLDSQGLGLIHWAADRGFSDMLRMLVQLGCDISLRDSSSQTALHYAASCGHTECVELLLELGADKSLKDDDDMTPAEVACDDSVLKLLA